MSKAEITHWPGFPEPEALIFALKLITRGLLLTERLDGLGQALFVIANEIEARKLLDGSKGIAVDDRITYLLQQYVSSSQQPRKHVSALLDENYTVGDLVEHVNVAQEMIETQIKLLTGGNDDRDRDDYNFEGIEIPRLPKPPLRRRQ